MNIQTLAAAGILFLIIVLCFISLIRRFTAGKTCCGTEKVKSCRKKLDSIKGSKIYNIEGMHCNNCRILAENAIDSLPGLMGKASLEKKTLTVFYRKDADLDEGLIIKKLGEAGFTVRL